jgi:5-hydroxyisourate hydrolase
MSRITTHILDVAQGRPARGVRVVLQRADGRGGWSDVGTGSSDGGGRIGDLAHSVEPGVYRLRFDTGAYFQARDMPTFYPHVEVTFNVTEPGGHYHVPLLLSPFGYSTYRGS